MLIHLKGLRLLLSSDGILREVSEELGVGLRTTLVNQVQVRELWTEGRINTILFSPFVLQSSELWSRNPTGPAL
jgi:hypothetical protein